MLVVEICHIVRQGTANNYGTHALPCFSGSLWLIILSFPWIKSHPVFLPRLVTGAGGSHALGFALSGDEQEGNLLRVQGFEFPLWGPCVYYGDHSGFACFSPLYPQGASGLGVLGMSMSGNRLHLTALAREAFRGHVPALGRSPR